MADEFVSSDGDQDAADDRGQAELFAAIYQELRLIASSRLRHHKRGTMLDTTALVHEAYLKLAGDDGRIDNFNSRQHFFATAALAMRQILTDQARRRLAHKRGGQQRNLTLNESVVAAQDSSVDILELDAALDKLHELDPGLADVVSLKYFGGLSLDEIAELQGASKRTISRSWRRARAFLHAQIAD
jgi:RNA polymerase sigma factor (TIGR02999 family)